MKDFMKMSGSILQLDLYSQNSCRGITFIFSLLDIEQFAIPLTGCNDATNCTVL